MIYIFNISDSQFLKSVYSDKVNYMETEFEICAENWLGRRYYFQRYGLNGKTIPKIQIL